MLKMPLTATMEPSLLDTWTNPCDKFSTLVQGRGIEVDMNDTMTALLTLKQVGVLGQASARIIVGEEVQPYFKSDAWELVKHTLLLNYSVLLKMLDTIDLGLPASRPRGFYIAVRHDVSSWDEEAFEANYVESHKYESS